MLNVPECNVLEKFTDTLIQTRLNKIKKETALAVFLLTLSPPGGGPKWPPPQRFCDCAKTVRARMLIFSDFL